MPRRSRMPNGCLGTDGPVTLPDGPVEATTVPVDTDKIEEAAKLLGACEESQ